ncbi:MAG TPA: MBL fold metallo-hydrolase [Candidatus Saccharimonadales bacterium]
MKITKYVHSCLLVETPDRVAIFDPGSMSEEAFDFQALARLDDIFITHMHGDHMSPSFIKKLIDQFPAVRITTTEEAAKILNAEGIKATTALPAGVELFDSPHEDVSPVFPQPEEIGIHYLNVLSDPGDSRQFHETKAILALPLVAPWGGWIKSYKAALDVRPQHVLPIHDWHLSDAARAQTYDKLETLLAEQGITFHKLETGVPVEIDVS